MENCIIDDNYVLCMPLLQPCDKWMPRSNNFISAAAAAGLHFSSFCFSFSLETNDDDDDDPVVSTSLPARRLIAERGGKVGFSMYHCSRGAAIPPRGPLVTFDATAKLGLEKCKLAPPPLTSCTHEKTTERVRRSSKRFSKEQQANVFRGLILLPCWK